MLKTIEVSISVPPGESAEEWTTRRVIELLEADQARGAAQVWLEQRLCGIGEAVRLLRPLVRGNTFHYRTIGGWLKD